MFITKYIVKVMIMRVCYFACVHCSIYPKFCAANFKMFSSDHQCKRKITDRSVIKVCKCLHNVTKYKLSTKLTLLTANMSLFKMNKKRLSRVGLTQSKS